MTSKQYEPKGRVPHTHTILYPNGDPHAILLLVLMYEKHKAKGLRRDYHSDWTLETCAVL